MSMINPKAAGIDAGSRSHFIAICQWYRQEDSRNFAW